MSTILGLPDPGNSYYEYDPFMELDPRLIFVFGSNLRGVHGSGAALTASEKYGACYGVGHGPTGRSYAIPTKNVQIITMPISDIEPYILKFVEYTQTSGKHFYLTPVGTGLAKIQDYQIAPLFEGIKNTWIPAHWKYFL